MSKPAPQFRQIAAPLDVPDDVLNALGDKLGVPSLVKPEPAPAPRSGVTPQDQHAWPPSPSGNPAPSLPAKSRPPAQTKLNIAPPPCPVTEKITVELPGYLATALRREGLERRTTARTLVMMGLKALGFEIDEKDLVPDGRRARPKRAP